MELIFHNLELCFSWFLLSLLIFLSYLTIVTAVQSFPDLLLICLLILFIFNWRGVEWILHLNCLYLIWSNHLHLINIHGGISRRFYLNRIFHFQFVIIFWDFIEIQETTIMIYSNIKSWTFVIPILPLNFLRPLPTLIMQLTNRHTHWLKRLDRTNSMYTALTGLFQPST